MLFRSELDDLIAQHHSHYTHVGLSMIDSMLQCLVYRVPHQRIRESLMQVDPVQWVFQQIKIHHHKYSVPGPMALWHHDGQHGECYFFFFSFNWSFMIFIGLIRWNIIIHGFTDGYLNFITGLWASNNNLGATVLQLFLDASHEYGIPSCMRGDHGVENILLAAWMEFYHGKRRGSYIWGRYVLDLSCST